jgi:hypothetical protein
MPSPRRRPGFRPVAGRAVRGRPRELEDGLNLYLYHPLAARLARLLKPTGISPNAVSVFGCLLVWGAAWAYTGLAWPQRVVAGFTLHLLWHVVDGADGDLARLTGKSSPTGELVDGVCDLAGHIVLYVALAAMLQIRSAAGRGRSRSPPALRTSPRAPMPKPSAVPTFGGPMACPGSSMPRRPATQCIAAGTGSRSPMPGWRQPMYGWRTP